LRATAKIDDRPKPGTERPGRALLLPLGVVRLAGSIDGFDLVMPRLSLGGLHA
jgi:hypothetical protein